MRKNLYEWLWGYFFVAPTVIGLLILNIWPIIKTFILSFSKDMGFGHYTLLGTENYTRMFKDTRVIESVSNTVLFAIISVPIGIFIALILASFMCREIKGVQVFRVIYFLPMIAAPAAVAMVWRMIYNKDFGIINSLLGKIGIDGPAWISDSKFALTSIIIIAIWSGLGQQIIILIAAIKNVNKSYYEAARLDGASNMNVFLKITIPLVSPSIFFLTITGIIGALRQFDLVYMMYHNTTNPATDAVRTLMYTYYQQAFVANDKAYASAIVIFTFGIIMFFTGIQFVAQRKWVYYE